MTRHRNQGAYRPAEQDSHTTTYALRGRVPMRQRYPAVSFHSQSGGDTHRVHTVQC